MKRFKNWFRKLSRGKRKGPDPEIEARREMYNLCLSVIAGAQNPKQFARADQMVDKFISTYSHLPHNYIYTTDLLAYAKLQKENHKIIPGPGEELFFN